jgi:hypothetical protein
LLVINVYFSVMYNRTGIRHSFSASVSLGNNKEHSEVKYAEPNSDTNCAANGTCMRNPDYVSKCLNIVYSKCEFQNAFQQKPKFIPICETMHI